MINKVVLVGRITRDVEVRKTTSGLSVASFTVACNRRPSSANSNPEADFISCVAWRQTADFLGTYVKKGALVGVEGRIQTRNYEQDGRRVYVTEVVCDSVQLLAQARGNERPANNAGFVNDVVPSVESNNAYTQSENFDDFTSGISLDISSDDLPF